MTFEEKLAQLGCLWSTSFVSSGTIDADEIARHMPHGIGQVTRIGAATDIRAEKTLLLDGPLVRYQQREIVETTVSIL